MVDAHQILNGSRDLTTPLSRRICLLRLALTTINLSTNLKSLTPPRLWKYERRYKISKMW